jgi:cell wall assembly regulator SMI1
MTPAEWRKFLTRFSRELLADEAIRSQLPNDVVESGWLGFPPATEKAITELEDRLETRLPPSYRSFLQTTNGWRDSGAFIYDLLPVSEVAWFRERHRDWLDAWREGSQTVGPARDVSDAEHRVYGAKQDSCVFRDEYWEATLAISGIGDSAIYLLNPLVVTRAGEWEAWFFANWNPGATRYRSFAEMMKAELDSVIALRDERD